jgi:hypothetical protein
MIEEFQLYVCIGLMGFLSLLSIIFATFLIMAKSNNKQLEKRLASREEIANESYLKFLVSSRDEAFTYIIDVQDKLEKFKTKVEPQLNYYNTYGTAVQGPHTILVKEISEAYEDLKTVMPQDNKEK